MEKAPLTSTSSSNHILVFSTPYRSASSTSNYFSDSDRFSDSSHPHEGSSPISIQHSTFSYCGYRSDSSVATPPFTQVVPPIGVFWDIENCQVPRRRSAIAFVQLIRDKFFTGYREVEFLAVCDVTKESTQLVEELNDAQVNVIHVPSIRKNAADEKLRQSIRRFADTYSSPAALILISGDVNFAPDLSDLRHRKKIHVILLHKIESSEALILCANEHYCFTDLVEDLPMRTAKLSQQSVDILVTNLPTNKDLGHIKMRLRRLSDNCGGKVSITTRTSAVIQFSCKEFASRALKRMEGEDIYGHKITVLQPGESYDLKQDDMIFAKFLSARKMRNSIFKNEDKLGWPLVMGQACQPVGIFPQASQNSLEFNSNTAHSSWGSSLPNVYRPVVRRPLSVRETNILQGSNFPANPRARNIADRAEELLFEDLTEPYLHFEEEQYYENKSKTMDLSTLRPPLLRNNTTPGFRRIKGRDLDTKDRPQGRPKSAYELKRTRTPSPGSPHRSKDVFMWSNQMSVEPVLRKNRTPTPHDMLERERPTSEPPNDTDCFFQPISQSTQNSASSSNTSTPILLQVTNLDQSYDSQELKKILLTMFTEHVAVLHVSVFMQSDGNIAAHVKVPSLQDAQFAISQLHRRKLGFRRMLISYVQGSGPNPQLVRAQIVSLLQEVPGHSLPLFKFRELFENRFLYSVSISDIYKMKDVCLVTEELSGRIVSLNPDHRNTPSPCFISENQNQCPELPYCRVHYRIKRIGKGWAEQDIGELPNVCIGLKKFSVQMHALLQSHNGSLPLPSLPDCYEAQFSEIEIDEKGGVPLEHLVSCLPRLEIYQGIGSVKYVRWANVTPDNVSQTDENKKCVSPSLASQLTLFNRELVDLLKTSPRCQIPFGRFIPAYHHHFGRQCRVADYGFTKLIDLLEAIPHVVQVMGEGNKRVVTLSHRAQVRRFTSDLLRVLKSLATKRIFLSEFPDVYRRVHGRSWNIVDYGVCDIQDILEEVPENTITISSDGKEVLISILKRDQTFHEKERTKKFASEVIELLRHAPHCTMLFNKFIPSYHHHFGHQCRVSDFGFTKLIELFEAIPDIVKIEDRDDGERTVSLTMVEKLKVLAEQIVTLIRSSSGMVLHLSILPDKFQELYGYTLHSDVYDSSSIEDLLEILQDFVKVIQTSLGPGIILLHDPQIHFLSLQVRRAMLGSYDCKVPAQEFLQMFYKTFNRLFNMDIAKKKMDYFLEITNEKDETYVELNCLQKFACQVYIMLFGSKGNLSLDSFDLVYCRTFGRPCQPGKLGFPNSEAALRAIPDTVIIDKSAKKLLINTQLSASGFPLPGFNSSEGHSSELRSQMKLHGPKLGEEEFFSDTHGTYFKSLGDSSVLGPKPFLPFHLKTPEKDRSMAPSEPSSCHSKLWSPPARDIFDSMICKTPQVDLPPWPPAPPISQSAHLMSPMPGLLAADSNPRVSDSTKYFAQKIPDVVAPHPSELPLPTRNLLGKFSSSNENMNSVGTTAIDADNTLFYGGTPEQFASANRLSKCKKRLAAQFSMS